VYLTLPREVLGERHESFEYRDASRAPRPSDVVAAPDAVEEAARILAAARNPIVIAKALFVFALLLVTVLMAAATIFFGIVPSPLFHLAHDVGTSLGTLL